MMTSFSKLATVTASTKRLPAISGGKRGAAVTNLTGLACTPLDPVDPELRQRLGLESPVSLLQTFVHGTNDIVEGDILVVSSVDYPIRSVADWTWQGSRFQHLVVEDVRK